MAAAAISATGTLDVALLRIHLGASICSFVTLMNDQASRFHEQGA
jgi:hypothetical protein